MSPTPAPYGSAYRPHTLALSCWCRNWVRGRPDGMCFMVEQFWQPLNLLPVPGDGRAAGLP